MDIPSDIGKRIGILGGTFDPIHNAHLALAEAVKKDFRLDSVLFIPALLPPHKQKVSTSFQHRAAMIELALEGREGLYLSKLEGFRKGPSFSIDTLRSLHRLVGEGAHFFFIVGMDAFVEISTWKEYGNLPRYANVIVADRPGPYQQSFEQIMRLDFPDFKPEGSGAVWSAEGLPGRIYHFEIPPMPVSSTEIRERAGLTGSDSDYLPGKVKQYIEEHGLYGNS